MKTFGTGLRIERVWPGAVFRTRKGRSVYVDYNALDDLKNRRNELRKDLYGDGGLMTYRHLGSCHQFRTPHGTTEKLSHEEFVLMLTVIGM